MLKILIKGIEGFDEETSTFLPLTPDLVIELEHSLLSVSKWESKYEKPFLTSGNKTSSETYDYIKMMLVSPGIDPDVLDGCSQENFDKIREYINSNQSATTFGQMPEHRGQGETITSELIYFWMSNFNIPFVCETWHLNRLFSLIKIANIKNSKPGKKLPRGEISQKYRDMNEQRKAQLGTKG